MIEGAIIDLPVRINYPIVGRYYYGLTKGFEAERYIISLVDGMSPHNRSVPQHSIEDPSRMEILLYF